MRPSPYSPIVLALLALTLSACGRHGTPLEQVEAPGSGPFPSPEYQPGETRVARAVRLAAADTLCERPATRPGSTLNDSSSLAAALIFKTGSPTGSYHAVGCGIAHVLETALDRRVILVNGGGSGENLQQLVDGSVDLAISQGDIAHHVYTGETGIGLPLTWPARLFRSTPGKQIRAVMGLHYEQVLAIGRRGLTSVSAIRGTSRVVIGGATSGTIGNAREVLHAIGVGPDTIKLSSRTAIPLLADTTASGVDVVFLTSAIDSALQARIDSVHGSVLSLNEDLRGHLAQEHRYYRDDTTPGWQTVKIRSLLLVRRDMPDDVVAGILEAIHRDIGSRISLIRDLTVEAARRDIVDDSTLTRDVSVPVHRAAARVFCADKGVACAYTLKFQILSAAALVLVLIGSFFFGIAFVGPVRRSALHFFPRIALSDTFGSDGVVAHWRWLLIPVFAVVVVLSGTLLVSLIEVWYSLQTGLGSPFTNRSFTDNLVWMLVFAASGYENETFPASLLAQVTSAGTVVVAIGGVLFLVGIVTSDGFAKRMKMDLRSDLKRLSSHIIICGWNRRAAAMVRTLCGTQLENRHLKIAIVAELPFDPIEKFDLAERQTVYVQGSPMKLANLEKAELARADTVVILSSDDASAEDRDARTIAIASQVETYVHRLVAEGEREHELHTVAELADPENRNLFRAAFIDQILCQVELDEQLLAQSVLNPGLTRFMEEILTVDNRNEIYEVPVREDEKYIGLSFDEALTAGRPDGLLLLAINRKAGRTVETAEDVDAADRGDGGLLTNPSTPRDRSYRIRAGDSLLFLSPDQKTLEDAFGEAAGWRSALLD